MAQGKKKKKEVKLDTLITRTQSAEMLGLLLLLPRHAVLLAARGRSQAHRFMELHTSKALGGWGCGGSGCVKVCFSSEHVRLYVTGCSRHHVEADSHPGA